VRRIFNVACVTSIEYRKSSRKNTYSEFSLKPNLMFIVSAKREYEIQFSEFGFYHPLPVTKIKYNFFIKSIQNDILLNKIRL